MKKKLKEIVSTSDIQSMSLGLMHCDFIDLTLKDIRPEWTIGFGSPPPPENVVIAIAGWISELTVEEDDYLQ